MQPGPFNNDPLNPHVNKTFNEIFWKTLDESLSFDPPSFGGVLQVLLEIKKTIEVCRSEPIWCFLWQVNALLLGLAICEAPAPL